MSYRGRALSSITRFEKVLSELNVAAEVLELPQSTRTAKEAAEAIGCELAQIAKSLVFQSADSRVPVLIIASGPNRVQEKMIAEYLKTSIMMADPDFVRSVTGYAIGGVPPFGHTEPLQTIIDEDLLDFQLIWAAAGTPRSVFSIEPQKLVEITNAEVMAVS
ncbi:MAG: YbaK/EbsC family protein [Firmicutes bacterium]|nr:YbaK/EbsC family protein [Bacillota bacterium]